MTGHPLKQLHEMGQSVWLDNLTRTSVRDGRLGRLIEEDGLSGVTSNPAIFHEAIASGEAYRTEIADLARRGAPAKAIYETLAIEDIQGAADLLRPTFDRSGGDDGFVSLEVSPHLARDTRATIAEAARLWEAVSRPNALIKIPGTDEGVPAIEECLTRGISINVTLLFSTAAHRKVIEAWWRALERRRTRGEPLNNVHSVASYFLSRIDVLVDRRLDAMSDGGDEAEQARVLRGRAAIASARLAYRLWTALHESERWQALQAAGAHVQKTLWASTSTKDDRYSDVRYVEALIGPRTINTMPDATLEAFRDHGQVEATLTRDVDQAKRDIAALGRIGIDLDEVAAVLVEEGIRKFVEPFDQLLHTLDSKAHASHAA